MAGPGALLGVAPLRRRRLRVPTTRASGRRTFTRTTVGGVPRAGRAAAGMAAGAAAARRRAPVAAEQRAPGSAALHAAASTTRRSSGTAPSTVLGRRAGRSSSVMRTPSRCECGCWAAGRCSLATGLCALATVRLEHHPPFINLTAIDVVVIVRHIQNERLVAGGFVTLCGFGYVSMIWFSDTRRYVRPASHSALRLALRADMLG